MNPPSADRSRGLPLGWLLLVSLLAYTVAIHHGVGPAPMAGATHWWQPRGFVLEWLAGSALGQWIEGERPSFVALGLPALALALAIFASTRSAVARTLAMASLIATALFLYYGLGGNRTLIWSFFGWRGSAVMALSALAFAAATSAPLLATSWLRQGWPARLVLGVPVLALVVLAQRDVTGTDPSLPFAISPWPVVTVFVIELAATLIAALLAVIGLVVAAGAVWPVRRPAALACLAAATLGLAFLAATRARPDATLLWVTLVLGAAGLVALSLAGEAAAAGAARRARGLSAGAMLVALPILAGLALTDRDYSVTRDGAAQQIIDALRRYYEREQAYPESLSALVAARDLDAIPRPSIGFGVFSNGDDEFTYQSFGMSYLLEFSAPRWVQCAYNPPYADEEPEEAAEAEPPGHGGVGVAHAAPAPGSPEASGMATDESAGGAWSCPSKPPELW